MGLIDVIKVWRKATGSKKSGGNWYRLDCKVYDDEIPFVIFVDENIYSKCTQGKFYDVIFGARLNQYDKLELVVVDINEVK